VTFPEYVLPKNTAEILNISARTRFSNMAAGKRIHDRKMADNPMLSVIWFLKHIKQNSNYSMPMFWGFTF